MKKNKILIVAIVIILLGTTGLVITKGWLSYKKGVVTENNNSPSTTSTSLPENEKGQPLYMVDGKIKQIISANPFKMTVTVRLTHIFNNPVQETIDKTIITTKDTTFLLQNLSTNTASDIEDPNSLKVGDDVVAWTQEPSSDVLNLEQMTATKIIKFTD